MNIVSEKPTTEKVLYRVQTGAFSNKANADTLEDKVKKAGFDTYMVKVGNLYKVQVGAFGVKANADTIANKLKAAGFDTYITTQAGNAVQPTVAPKKSIKEVAKEVVLGKWGNGAERKKKLEAAGYNYSDIQKEVNKLIK